MVLISESAVKVLEVGTRVAVEFDKNDWSIGTILKATPTGYRIDFDYGEQKLIKTATTKVVAVEQKRKIKKGLTLAEVKALKPVKKSAPSPSGAPRVKKVSTTPTPKTADKPAPSPVKPVQKPGLTIDIAKPAVKPTTGDEAQIERPDDKDEISLEHKIGNHSYWESTKHSDAAKKRFLQHAWHAANKTFFDGKLVVPNLSFLKAMKNFRGLGYWRAHTRDLKVSPRLFHTTQARCLQTIVHEMCHQAVSEIDKVVDRSDGGHGHNWQMWMRKCGLTPSRYSQDDRTTFMSDKEKKELEVHRKAIEVKKAVEATKVSLCPGNNKPAQFFDPTSKVWIKGLIVCPNDKAGKRWIFIDIPTYSRWRIIPNNWFYELDTPEDKQKFTSFEFTDSARRIAGGLELKRLYAKMR